MVIVAEFKVPPPSLARTGLSLLTSTVRCTRADQLDMRLNSHSCLNLITALIQAYKAGADEALLLDGAGLVASCNATNLFFVRDGTVCTSTGRCCFNGIMRSRVISLCGRDGIALQQDQFTLVDVYGTGETFVTGTFGGITPVRLIDGRAFGMLPGPMTARLIGAYNQKVAAAAQ